MEEFSLNTSKWRLCSTTHYSFVGCSNEWYCRFGLAPSPNSPIAWRWRQNSAPKHWYSPTVLHSIKTQSTTIWIFADLTNWKRTAYISFLKFHNRNRTYRIRYNFAHFPRWDWWIIKNVGFEVFTAVTMKNAVIWDVAPCRSCEINWRFGRTSVQLQRSSYKIHVTVNVRNEMDPDSHLWLLTRMFVILFGVCPHPR
jgi:hypothetical protein